MLGEVTVTRRYSTGVSGSPTMKEKVSEVSSVIVRFLSMLEISGGSFTGSTVRTKVSVAVAVPSSTFTVISAVPD